MSSHPRHDDRSGSLLGRWLFGARPAAPPKSSTSTRAPTFDLSDFLPQPVPESRIRQGIKDIKLLLENHVDTFYNINDYSATSHSIRSRELYSPSDSDNEALDIGRRTVSSPGLSRIVRDPRAMSPAETPGTRSASSWPWQEIQSPDEQRMRKADIQYAIAERLIGCIEPSGNAQESFLPWQVVAMICAMSVKEPDNSVFMAALSQWKTLTTYLLNIYRSEIHLSEGYREQRRRNIEHAISSLDRFLMPYVDQTQNDERVKHLRALMEITADFGLLLLTQPALYEFNWTAPSEDPRENRRSHSSVDRPRRSRGRSYVIVFPALTKVTDDGGARLPKPQTVSNPDVLKKMKVPRRTESDLMESEETRFEHLV